MADWVWPPKSPPPPGIVITSLGLVVRINELAADFPYVQIEVQGGFVVIIEQFQLGGIDALEGPHIVVERNEDLGSQVPPDTKAIRGGHFILDTGAIVAVGDQGHINFMLLPLFVKTGGEMRIAAVVKATARGLDNIINRSLVHIRQGLGGKIIIIGRWGQKTVRSKDSTTTTSISLT